MNHTVGYRIDWQWSIVPLLNYARRFPDPFTRTAMLPGIGSI